MAEKTPHVPMPEIPGAPAGKRFGKYVLQKELGRGGMGVVYQAWDTELEREVAIKMLITADSATREEIERLQREAKAAARLHHPNIIGIHHVGTQEGRAYFTMEYVRGHTLDELTAGLTERKLLEYLRDIARALHYAHGKGVIHRDVKPSNILISEEGKPWLMDFGLAKQLRESKQLTATGFVMGTPNYMSPEQVHGLQEQIDGQSDVFSLGSVLYFMLTGECPFERATVLKTVVAVVQDPPRPPRSLRPAISRDVETICLKALEKERTQRYPSAAAMADDLDRFLAGQDIVARPIGTVERALRWARARRLQVALAAVVVVALAGGAVFWRAYAAQQAEARRIAAEAERDRLRREEEAQKKARGETFLKAGRDQMAIAERCQMTGRADDLKKSLIAALGHFDAALAADDGLAAAFAERGRARSLLGEKEHALEDLGAALARQEDLAQAYYERGKIRLGRFIDRMTAAVMERRGKATSLNAQRARAFQQEASEDLARAAGLAPGPGREWVTQHARGALAFLAGDPKSALAALDAALDQNPFLDDALDLRAYLHLIGAHDLVRARADLDRAVQANAFNVNALHRRGVVRYEQGDVKGALEDYDRALAIDPSMWRARLNRGRARLAAADPNGAMADFGAALAAEPDNLLALQDRAEARLAAKDWAGAEVDLTRALTLAADSAWLHLRRAVARRQAGALPGALADAEAAVGDPETRRDGLLERALVREATHDAAGAIADYGECLKVDERCAEAYVGRGLLHAAGGRGTEAAADFRRFLDLFPDHPRAAEVRAALERLAGGGK